MKKMGHTNELRWNSLVCFVICYIFKIIDHLFFINHPFHNSKQFENGFYFFTVIKIVSIHHIECPSRIKGCALITVCKRVICSKQPQQRNCFFVDCLWNFSEMPVLNKFNNVFYLSVI